jgi:hypothetical protein
MPETKPNPEADAKASRAGAEEELDKEIADTFPASDPPSTTPVAGTRKAEREAEKK